MSGPASDDRAERLAWFEDLYRDAADDPDKVPWARLAPHPGLLHWSAGGQVEVGRAIDIGCGLGDNAEFLAGLGCTVTAFDLSKTAIEWARRRFPDFGIEFRVADLFALPEAWTGWFDLVSEVYTLQALPAELRGEALRNIAALAAPGGRIVVVCMARDENAPVDGPPWPLARSELSGLLEQGFDEVSFDDVSLGESARRHFVAVYRRRGTG